MLKGDKIKRDRGEWAHSLQDTKQNGKGSFSQAVFPYISHIGYVLPQRQGFSCRFCLNTGIDFTHFDLESGMVFEGTTGVYERIYRFRSKWVKKKEKYVNSKWIFRTFFGCCSNLSNNDIRGQVWKRVWILEAGSENGCEKWHILVWSRGGIWRTGRHTLPRIPRSTPPVFLICLTFCRLTSKLNSGSS